MSSDQAHDAVQSLVRQDRQVLELFGITVESIEAGQVRLRLAVAENMVNSQSFCHGGILFALADTAAAYACGSLNLAPATVDAHIAYLAPAKLGEVITAAAAVAHAGSKVVHVKVELRSEDQLLATYTSTLAARGHVV